MRKIPWKHNGYYQHLSGLIRKELKQSNNPKTAKELGIALSQHHTDINRCLYFFMRDVKQNQSFEWSIK